MSSQKPSGSRLGLLAAAVLGMLALLALPTVAAARDRNHDHIPDRWEKRHHLSMKVNQAQRDQDGDHLRNRAEFLSEDNPRDRDSDDDGVMDGAEKAGTIASFDASTGRLVIDLFNSETISGLVDEGTEVKCETEHPATASASSDGSESGDGEGTEPGDDESGEGSEAGDDENDQGEEPGDDDAGHGEEAGDDDGGQAGEPADGGGDSSGPASDNSGTGSENSGSGSDESGDGGNCTTADLVPGAVVQEAELKVQGGQATFEEVELSGKSA